MYEAAPAMWFVMTTIVHYIAKEILVFLCLAALVEDIVFFFLFFFAFRRDPFSCILERCGTALDGEWHRAWLYTNHMYMAM